MNKFRYCPVCGTKLGNKLKEGNLKLCCRVKTCEYVYWENPTPVVLILIELKDRFIVTHNVEWPEWKYSLISGFVDTKEDPREAAMREIREELNLETIEIELITTSIYENLNQVMIGYYAKTKGEVVLNEENSAYKLLSLKELENWEFGKGSTPLVREWLSRENVQVNQC